MNIADRTASMQSPRLRDCSVAPRAPLVAVKAVFASGFRSPWHCTDRAQLIYPNRGVMSISTRAGTWVVPPMRACWLPAAEEHAVENSSGLEMHSVYGESLARFMPAHPAVVSVQPWLRELIRALADVPTGHAEATLGGVVDNWLAGQIVAEQPVPLTVPQPASPRLQQIARTLMLDPGDRRRLDAWAAELGTTTRSLARAFRSETGMSYTEFRRQTRLHVALEKLALGQSVTMVALDMGFSSSANFIAMFRRATGRTPASYFRGGKAVRPGR
jgi:AraC-like DNA-binding protein